MAAGLSVSFQRCCIALVRTYCTTNECHPCWEGTEQPAPSCMAGTSILSLHRPTAAQRNTATLLCSACHTSATAINSNHSPTTHKALHQARMSPPSRTDRPTPIVVVFCQLAAHITCSPDLAWPGCTLLLLHLWLASTASPSRRVCSTLCTRSPASHPCVKTSCMRREQDRSELPAGTVQQQYVGLQQSRVVLCRALCVCIKQRGHTMLSYRIACHRMSCHVVLAPKKSSKIFQPPAGQLWTMKPKKFRSCLSRPNPKYSSRPQQTSDSHSQIV